MGDGVNDDTDVSAPYDEVAGQRARDAEESGSAVEEIARGCVVEGPAGQREYVLDEVRAIELRLVDVKSEVEDGQIGVRSLQISDFVRRVRSGCRED